MEDAFAFLSTAEPRRFLPPLPLFLSPPFPSTPSIDNPPDYTSSHATAFFHTGPDGPSSPFLGTARAQTTGWTSKPTRHASSADSTSSSCRLCSAWCSSSRLPFVKRMLPSDPQRSLNLITSTPASCVHSRYAMCAARTRVAKSCARLSGISVESTGRSKMPAFPPMIASAAASATARRAERAALSAVYSPGSLADEISGSSCLNLRTRQSSASCGLAAA